MHSTRKPKLLQDSFSPEFIEFIDDTYDYLSKWSGSKFSETLNISRKALDARKRRRREKHGSK